MADLKDKIIHETTTQIKLYKQGVFWVAHEQSAFFIAMQKEYKPPKKIHQKTKTTYS